MALEAFKMARTSQSKLIAISSNPKTIMLLLIVGSNGYPEVISSAINLICEAHCDSAQDVRQHITVQCHARRQTGMTRTEHIAKNP